MLPAPSISPNLAKRSVATPEKDVEPEPVYLLSNGVRATPLRV